MNDHEPWHSQDAFWKLFEPILFNAHRRSSAKGVVDNIIKLLGIEGEARILDLCCGIGLHSLELSRQGFDVTGVDRTPSYLEKARAEAEKHNLNIAFVLSDMREYSEPEGFDIVLNLFGSFGYFENPEDDQRVVLNMYESLRTGGQFLIETMGKEILARDFQERDWSQEGDLFILSERNVSQNWGRIDTRWIAIRGADRVEHHVSVRSYSAVELSSLLQESGFSEVQVYGSLEGTKYDRTAQRLVVVGKKL